MIQMILKELEELPSLLHKKEKLTFLADELVTVNNGIFDEQRLVSIGATLPTPQQERYRNKFIEHFKFCA